jgi:hypothetical protein
MVILYITMQEIPFLQLFLPSITFCPMSLIDGTRIVIIQNE